MKLLKKRSQSHPEDLLHSILESCSTVKQLELFPRPFTPLLECSMCRLDRCAMLGLDPLPIGGDRTPFVTPPDRNPVSWLTFMRFM